MKDNIGILDPDGKNINPLNNKPFSDNYKKLAKLWSKYPAYENPKKVIKQIKDNQVILVLSGTGSGKTVLTPKYCLHAFDYDAKIAITLPKQLVTKSAAEFAAATLDVDICKEVGYQYRGAEKCQTNDTKLLYATDGTIVAKLLNDPYLKEYNAVIVDEVHERKTQIDFLLYLLKNTLHLRKDFKVILMSATVDEKLFENYYKEFKFEVINMGITKTNFPIKSIFADKTALPQDYIEKGFDIIREIIKNDKDDNDKNILFFVTSSNEAQDVCNRINEDQELNLYCAPLYSNIDPSSQAIAQDKELYKSQSNKKYKIVVSTNVAESSLTVENIQYVIDSGYELFGYYDPAMRASVLVKQLTSKAQATQRKGRVGRVSAGTVYHMYTEDDFNNMKPFPEPAIRTSNITTESLKLLSIDTINNVNNLKEVFNKFIEPPTKEYIQVAINELKQLGLIKDNKISNLGKLVSDLQLEPMDGVSVVAAKKLRCLNEVLGVICLKESIKINMGGLFRKPLALVNLKPEDKDKYQSLSKKYNNAISKFNNKYGDHVALMKVFDKINGFYEDKKFNKINDFCFEHFLDKDAIIKAIKYYSKMKWNIRNKLKGITEIQDLPNLELSNEIKMLGSFYYGYQLNIANLYKDGYRFKTETQTVENLKINKNSYLAKSEPDKVMFMELFKSQNAEINIVSKITDKLESIYKLFDSTNLIPDNYNISESEISVGGSSDNFEFDSKEDCERNKNKISNEEYRFLDRQELSSDIVANKKQLDKKIIEKRNETKLSINEYKSNKTIYDKYLEEMFSLKLYDIKDQDIAFKNTLDYLFEDMFMGIYVRIIDNKLEMFVPFYNIDYKNTWGDKLEFKNYQGSTKNYKDFLRMKKKDIKNYRDESVLYDPTKWNSNNCLVGNAYPIYISETRLGEFKFLIEQVCKNRKIKDVEFFINKRDFPILRKDLEYPYPNVSKDKLPKFTYEYMLPILSVCTNPNFADILIPTEDDINLLFQKFIPNRCENSYFEIKDKTKWEDKIPKAVFRGKLTGCGITTETNQRLKLSQEDYRLEDKDIIDAGFISWNLRDKINAGVVEYINPNDFNFRKKNFMEREEQYKYKYLINVDGHVAAFRLLSELMTNSLVLKVDSMEDWEIWYSRLLKPYEHYVPIKKDLSDLEKQINWCRDNDGKCKEIIKNAHELVNKYITKDGLLDYMESLLNKIPVANQKGGDDVEIKHKELSRKYKIKFKTLDETSLKPGKSIIIVPYRDNKFQDRKKQLDDFINFFKDKDIEIIIVEQSDDGKKFNRGKLLNIGYDVNKDKNIFIFHDVDILPDDYLLGLYNKTNGNAIHLATKNKQYGHNYNFLGASLSVTKDIIKRTNGHPNNYWGWGGEDDNFRMRLVINKVKINKLTKGEYSEMEHPPTRKIKDLTLQTPWENNIEDIETGNWKNNGVNNLDYKIIDKKKITDKICKIKVEI